MTNPRSSRTGGCTLSRSWATAGTWIPSRTPSSGSSSIARRPHGHRSRNLPGVPGAASKAVVGGFGPPDDPFTSWSGGVRVARPGERWPLGLELPMVAIAQFNLDEPPFLPDGLKDLALITMFADRGGVPVLGK